MTLRGTFRSRVGRVRFREGSYRLAALLAVTLSAVLLCCVLVGRSEFGGPLALGFVLTAVPTLPVGFCEGVRTIAVRGATGLAAASVAVLLLYNGVPTGPMIVAVAAVGTLTATASSTPALAMVLVVAASDHAASIAYSQFVLLYAGGAVLVAAAFGLFAAVRVLARRTSVDRLGDDVTYTTDFGRVSEYGYTASMTIGVGVAVCLQALLPAGWEGGHWLITCVILTLQVSPEATRQRLRKRLTGNTIGALIAGVVLATAPMPVVTVALIAVLFLIAFAWRPIDYFWWAVSAPPLLLLTGTFPHLYPWYEGAVRLAMNVVGALIVVLVAFTGPRLYRRARGT